MTKTFTRVTRKESLERYPDGCVFCGHDVAYLSRQAVEPGSEASFCDRPRTTERYSEAYPMCPSCAKGQCTRAGMHSPRCRGCR